MAAGKLFNLARMTVSSAPGTSSTIGLLAAVSGYNTFANAGVVNGDVVVYAINDGALSECGTAIYSSSGPSLTSRTPSDSTSGGSAITATSSAQIILLARAQDILSFAAAQTFTDAEQAIARHNLYAGQFDALSFNGMQINGSMEVSQRNGTNSVALSTGVAASIVDTWNESFGSASLVMVGQQVTPAGSPSFGAAFPFALQLKATTGAAIGANDFANISTNISGYRWSRLGFGAAGAQAVTIGFWVYATIAGTMTVSLSNSGSARCYVANVTINNATTWEYKTVTILGDTTGTWLTSSGTGAVVGFNFAIGSTYQGTPNTWTSSAIFGTSSSTNFFASNNNLVQITGVVVVPGTEVPISARSPLIMRPYDTELALCNPPAAPIDALAFNGMQVNGSMEVSQENGTVAVAPVNNGTAKYVVDGMVVKYAQSSIVMSAQQVTPPGSPSFGQVFQKALQLKSTTGAAMGGGDWAIIEHPVEGYRVSRLGFGASGAQSVTIGFWVYATIAGTMAVCLHNSDASRCYVADVVINNATTWEYKTVTIAGDVTGTWLYTTGIGLNVIFGLGTGSASQTTPNVWSSGSFKLGTSSTTNFFASNNNIVCVTGLVVLPGIQAPPSSRSPFIMRPFDTELQLCQRYYSKSFPYATPVVQNAGVGGALTGQSPVTGSNLFSMYPQWPTRMRATPTVTTYNPGAANANWRDVSSSADVAATVFAESETGAQIYASGSATAAHTMQIHWSANARL